eukprot:2380513-Rhodomonas_salina.3
MLKLANIPGICDLDLSRNALSWPGIRALLSAVDSCKSLRKLYLKSAALGEEAMRLLAEGPEGLAQLEVCELGLNPGIAAAGAAALGQGVRHWSRLTHLGVSGNLIQGAGMRGLVCGLQECAALDSLDASENAIGAEGARALCEHLRRWPRLASLNLAGNFLDDDDVVELAAGELPTHDPSAVRG